MARQGPHQAAQKSTITGTGDLMTFWSKSLKLTWNRLGCVSIMVSGSLSVFVYVSISLTLFHSIMFSLPKIKPLSSEIQKFSNRRGNTPLQVGRLRRPQVILQVCV